MKSVLAKLTCGSVFAVALITLAVAQSPTQKNNSGVSKVAIYPATVQNLVSAHDYRPPQGIAFKAADFISENVRLTAQWFYAAENKGRKLPTIIIAHGWGTTAANFRQDAIDFASAGYLVMLFDYRGWGDSDGRVMKTSTAQVRELRGYIDPWEQVNDWFNAIHYAATDPMVDAARIGILGSDLSGGHVIYVAAHEPRVKALVSEVSSVDARPYKPYQSDPAKVIAQANAAASRIATGQEEYPVDHARVVRSSVGANFVGAPVGANLLRWAPVELASRVSAPALFVLAENEELFSNTNNGQLACERVTGPRKMVMLPNITHYGIYDTERKRAITLAIAWFDKYLKSAISQTGTSNLAATKSKEPERGECSPPPEPPKGEEDKDGSGEGNKTPETSTRWN